MKNQFPNQSESGFTLWALVRSEKTDPIESSNPTFATFYNKTEDMEGLMLFPSVLDAEIFCQRLRVTGSGDWYRQRLENINLAQIMKQISIEKFRLVLALGFYATDTNDLLLDAARNLMPPLLPIQFKILPSSDEGEIHLGLDSKLPAFIRSWWNRFGDVTYADKIASMQNWSDDELAECATEALEKASIIEVIQYQQAWQSDGCGDECAIFMPGIREWRFGTLEERAPHALH